MGEMRYAYKILFRRPRLKWEDNIKKDFKETECGGVEWILQLDAFEIVAISNGNCIFPFFHKNRQVFVSFLYVPYVCPPPPPHPPITLRKIDEFSQKLVWMSCHQRPPQPSTINNIDMETVSNFRGGNDTSDT
jgi:hypothetical protein